MFWPILFALGMTQGGFLITVFSLRNHPNRVASGLLQALLAWFVLSNLDDFLLVTGYYRVVPCLFGWSFGAILAYGPLLYLYLQNIADPGLRWKKQNWLHFLPLACWITLSMPFVFMSPTIKITFLEKYLSGEAAVTKIDYITSAIQVLHLSIYFWVSFLLVRKWQRQHIQERSRWLIQILALFFLIWAAYLLLVLWNIANSFYAPGATYFFTFITTGTGYFLTFKLIMEPRILTPTPSKKAGNPKDEEADNTLQEQLERGMRDEKPFTDPELKLSGLAAHLGVPAHRLSGLINQRYGMSFSEFIARRRVEEFLVRLNDERFSHLSLYGLAMEVGFNSKSAFNEAFKRVTGKNPSDFRR